MDESSPEDDDLDLNEDLKFKHTDEDTNISGNEHFKRPAEDSINQDVKRHRGDNQSLAAANNSFEEEKPNKQSTTQYDIHVGQLNDTINGLQGQLESAHQQMKELLVTNECLQKEKKDLTLSYERQLEESINQEKKRHREDEKSLSAANNSFEKEKTSKEFSIKHNHNDTIDDLNSRLASACQQLKDRCVTIERLETEKKDLTLRLSKLAGANLTYNNPNIADLSDENRPTKLAEDFSELYDNELTDAFESLDSEDEREKTQTMLAILKKAYRLCYDTSKDHVKAVKNGFATLNIVYELEEVVGKGEEEALTNTEQVEAESEKQDSSPTTGFNESLLTEGNQTDEDPKNGVMLEETLKSQHSEREATMTLLQQNQQLQAEISEQFVDNGKIEEHTEKTWHTEVSQSAAVGPVKGKMSEHVDEHCETSNKMAGEQSKEISIVSTDQEETIGANKECHVIQSAAASGGQAEATVTKKMLPLENIEQHETRLSELKMQADNNEVYSPKTQTTFKKEGNNEEECVKNSLDNVKDDEQKTVTNLHMLVEATSEMQDSSPTTSFNESLPTAGNQTDEYPEKGVMLEETLKSRHLVREATVRLLQQNEQPQAQISKQFVENGKIEEHTEKTMPTEVSQSAAVGPVNGKTSEYVDEHCETSKKMAGEQSKKITIVNTDQGATTGANNECHVIQSVAASGGQAEATVTEKMLPLENIEQHERKLPEMKMQANNNAVYPSKTQVTLEKEGNNEEECFKYNLDNVEDDEQKTVTNLHILKNNENVRKVSKGVQSFQYKTLTAPFTNLTKEQMKTVSDIRKFFESELTESFQKESAELIAKSLSEDLQKKEFVQKYIQKCLQISWSMCRHEPPVFILFIEQGTDKPFDTNMFRTYTKTGKYLDYVVWPPLYLYENGPMLLKGIAQGRQ